MLRVANAYRDAERARNYGCLHPPKNRQQCNVSEPENVNCVVAGASEGFFLHCVIGTATHLFFLPSIATSDYRRGRKLSCGGPPPTPHWCGLAARASMRGIRLCCWMHQSRMAPVCAQDLSCAVFVSAIFRPGTWRSTRAVACSRRNARKRLPGATHALKPSLLSYIPRSMRGDSSQRLQPHHLQRSYLWVRACSRRSRSCGLLPPFGPLPPSRCSGMVNRGVAPAVVAATQDRQWLAIVSAATGSSQKALDGDPHALAAHHRVATVSARPLRRPRRRPRALWHSATLRD